MSSEPFIGRSQQLKGLELLLKKKTATLVVVRGRRRIGKSRLIEEFARDKRFLSFSGLPPTTKQGAGAKIQRHEFIRQLNQQMNLPELKADDWGDLLTLLAEHTKSGRVIILLDEISWMADQDETFLGKLKIVWDLYFKKNPKLILVLCGSVSSWIEKNILSGTELFGRIGHKVELDELGLSESKELLITNGFQCSAMEIFMMLSITGGVPWYLELMNSSLSATNNIKQLCFVKDGILVDEFTHIFHDLFQHRSALYIDIVRYLSDGPATYKAIAEAINYETGGPLTSYLNDLTTAGFLGKDYTWSFKTGKNRSIMRYRLRDNYLRFYLKFIDPNIAKINKNQYKQLSLTNFPGFAAIMGLQFENIILTNRELIFESLGISNEEIVADNPYYQTRTKRQQGCQIDYLIQTRFNTLFVCEMKFLRREIGVSVCDEVETKCQKLVKGKSFVTVPVLIHVNGVTAELEDKGYFAKIINFSELLNTAT